MATQAQFGFLPVAAIANVSAALNARVVNSSTAGLVLLFSPGESGTGIGARIDTLRFQATGTTAAGVLRVWLFDGSSSWSLLQEILTTGVTPSSTAVAESHQLEALAWLVPAGYSLWVGTGNAEAWNVAAFGAWF